MTCRTIPGGSLTTTFVQRRHGLTDAQATSLFHALRRDARANQHSVTASEYQAALDAIEQDMREHPAAPGLQTRGIERLARARSAGLPADAAEAWAVTRMGDFAAFTQNRQQRAVGALAARGGLTQERAQEEWDYQYGHAPRDVSRALPSMPDGMPNDPATRWAWHIAQTGVQCGTCGRFASPRTPHTCPADTTEWRRRTEPAAPVDPFTSTPVTVPATPAEPGDGWTSDMDAFQEAYDKARARIDEGQPRVPTFAHLETVPGGVTCGLGGTEGTTFGLEIEIDFPGDDYPYTSKHEFAARLYEAGISLSPHAERWHFVGGEGQNREGGEYTEDPDGWVCEFDRSVDDVEGQRGVEVKSQILHDEPRTWANLRRICEIAEECGGRPTARTGLHVNVGATGFDPDDPTVHGRLLRLTAAFDDTMIRMATNPESGPDHRGRHYCQPVTVPPTGFRSVSHAQQHADHYAAVNLGHLPAEGQCLRTDSRIEMRIFDSTLDPGRIQASVNLALGLVAAARNGEEPGMGPMRAGATREEFGSRRLSGERWERATAPFRRLMDILARQGLDKTEQQEQLTHLFAAARWARS